MLPRVTEPRRSNAAQLAVESHRNSRVKGCWDQQLSPNSRNGMSNAVKEEI